MSRAEQHAHQVKLYREGRCAELLLSCQRIIGAILDQRGLKGDAFEDGRQELNRHALEMFQGKRCSPWDCICMLSTYLWKPLDGALLDHLEKRDKHRTIPAHDLIAFGYAVAVPGETPVAAPAAQAKSRKRADLDPVTNELRLRGRGIGDHEHDDDAMLDGRRTPARLVDIIIHAGDEDAAEGLDGYSPDQVAAVFNEAGKLIGDDRGELITALRLHLTPIDREAKLARFAELFDEYAPYRFDRRVALAQKRISELTERERERLRAAALGAASHDAVDEPVSEEERRELIDLIEAPIPVYEDEDELPPSTDAPPRMPYMSTDDVLWLARRHQPSFRPDSLDMYLQVIEK